MTAHRTHQITPTLIGDGPWGEELAQLVDFHGQGSATRSVHETAAPPSPPALPPTSGEHRTARCALRPEPGAVKVARDFTRATLEQWRADGLFDNATVVDDAAVIMSELVTNAVRYGLRAGVARSAADARIELVLLRRTGRLVCVVIDPNPGPPMLMEADCVAETGRGLGVVENLSNQWGWTPLSTDRKAVWAALALA